MRTITRAVSATDTRTAPAPGENTLLEVRDLRVDLHLRRGTVKAVAGLSYHVGRHETLAIVGESGSGKSVAAHAVLGVLNELPVHEIHGSVRLSGTELLTMPERERRAVRGDRLSLISQNSSLNPVFTVGWQVGEPFRVHRGMSQAQSLKHAAELLDRVGIPSASTRVNDYPHQFSGGQRQRASIAMALALEPDVLIADEPTTALDVTIQAQIMELLTELKDENGMGLILITHDLGLVAEAADRVVVMYAGREVETGTAEEIFTSPAHPYTRGLLRSIPDVSHKRDRLHPIKGSPPDLMRPPSGCPFHPRCEWASELCSTELPPAQPLGPGRAASCHRLEEVAGVSHRD
ncbi:ABC transporter ATP-binding protein [Georgenia daeguensis]